ncbi:uncharacterized protein K441DRAFT_701114 [Cenococcum geophilum 1.58]|uniref:Uncharacterized protein n=1 Tax=Cenococcum geophilum 1.58 TaxID=794803 RepID=A0ACC8ENF3_9PEZI|nr:hypothetical protein K441DRAFT_701114 [Cenococcum geophilum 1.58]
MLTYLDRQKFEEIRAKWEAAQPKKQQQTGRMPGRKERPSEAYQPLDIDNDGRNRKPRRFSSIASFISPPNSFMTKAFSRRKQPARSSVANTSMTTLMNVSEAERLLSASRQPSEDSGLSPIKYSPVRYDPVREETDWQNSRKALPRSQTMSNIPVPTKNRTSSGAASITQSCSSTNLPRSRIPTPIHYPDQLAAKHIAAGKAFASASESPVKAFQRSHTPPNLLGDVNKQRPAFMIPRKAIYKERTLPTPTKPSNKESMRRVGKVKEYSPLEDRITRRDSKSMASKSIAQTEENQDIDSKARGKQPGRRTPVLSEINKSNTNEGIRTPATVKCYQPASKPMTKPPQLSSSHEITRVKPMGPRNPPTPPQPKTPGAPAISGLDVFATKFTTAIRKKSQFSPQSDCSTPSQAPARLVREVRSRSDPVPPVPPVPLIPAQYCTPTSETKEDEGVEPPEVANMFQISQSQTSRYWSGRFTSLSDRFRNDTFDVEMRPIDEASNHSNRSSEERRGREVFKELSGLCMTKEAKDSLRVSDFHEGSPPNNRDPPN